MSGITLSLFDEAGRNRLFETLDVARRQGSRVAFDTNFRPRGWPDLNAARAVYDRMFSRSDIVLASVEDNMLLHGSAEAADLIARLQAAHVPEMVVKLAKPACQVIVAGADVLVQAEPVGEIVDTTAAGDSFAAAYIAARRAGASPRGPLAPVIASPAWSSAIAVRSFPVPPCHPSISPRRLYERIKSRRIRSKRR